MIRKLIVIGLVFLLSCDKNEPIQYVQLLKETTLKEGHTLTVLDEARTFEVFLKNVNDSRCPSNAACISAGNVATTFVINDEEELVLCLGQCTGDSFQQVDSAVFRVNSKKYYLKLTEVSPYPIIPDEKRKTAKISVFK